MLIRKLIRRIVATFCDWVGSVPPRVIQIRIVNKVEVMAWKYDLEIVKDGTESIDITHGELTAETTVVGEARTATMRVEVTDTIVGPFFSSEGTDLNVTMRWFDDAGLVSEVPFTTTIAIVDDQAPGTPAGVRVVNKVEIPDDQVPPIDPPILPIEPPTP